MTKMKKRGVRSSSYDPLCSEKIKNSDSDGWEEPNRRNVYYSALTRDIVKDNRSSQRLKKIFFVIVCLVFLVVCVSGAATMLIVAVRGNPSIEDLGVVIAAFGAIISAIIVLPKIIAKHLFPSDSESIRFKFINSTQIADNQVTISDQENGIEWISFDDDLNVKN